MPLLCMAVAMCKTPVESATFPPPSHPQVITCADYHPHHCSVFAYSSSKGLIRLADQRAAALCDQHAKLFEDTEPAVGGGCVWCWPAG